MAARRTAARETAPPPYLAAATAPGFVVDASVSAAWLLPGEATAYTAAALHATVHTDVWVPALWLLEVANLLQSAQRRRRINAAKRTELAAAAAGLRLQVCREPVALPTLDALAAEHALSAYDACYLELALRRRLPLATLDAALLAAMKRCGVPLATLCN
ncbi:MAG: type II toxin-antitoxin system VapC family toxin [Rubrivivax sp.]|nr:type II toxin-antitoxin system VapC family toxin [Rubrivivax sp.]